MDQSGRRPKLLKDYTPPDYLVDEANLEFQLDPKATRVTSKLRVRANPDGRRGMPLVLDGEGLRLESLAIDGVPLPAAKYRLDDKSLTIPEVPAGPFTLETAVLCDPEANTVLSGLYRSRGTYCTQCEAEGFRRITYSLDRPDNMSTSIRCGWSPTRRCYPVLLSNGNPVARGDVCRAGGISRSGMIRSPSRLICSRWSRGDLAHVEDTSSRRRGAGEARHLCDARQRGQSCGFAMGALKRSMKWDEDAFGREYDLDIFNIVAVSAFNFGAMENKGLNIFNDKLILARPDTATRRATTT